MTPQLPPGATNTARSVTVDGSDHSSPHKATQGEKGVTHTDLLRIRALRDDRDTCRCLLCRGATTGYGGLVWSTFTADMAPIAANPSSLETSP